MGKATSATSVFRGRKGRIKAASWMVFLCVLTHTETKFPLTDNIQLSDAGESVFYPRASPQAP